MSNSVSFGHLLPLPVLPLRRMGTHGGFHCEEKLSLKMWLVPLLSVGDKNCSESHRKDAKDAKKTWDLGAFAARDLWFHPTTLNGETAKMWNPPFDQLAFNCYDESLCWFHMLLPGTRDCELRRA